MLNKKVFSKLFGLVLLLGVFSSANATIWTIDATMGGSSGFGASSFHDASDGTPMTGSNLAGINTTASGTYDDVTGALSGTFSYGTTSFTLDTGTSSLIFTAGDQFLDSAGSLAAVFSAQIGQLIDATINFTAGAQCCGGTGQDPNSFVITGSGDTAVLSLWGFTGIQGTGNSVSSHVLAADYGMDLRLGLSKVSVPTPPVLALFGLGLLGLGFGRSRKVNMG